MNDSGWNFSGLFRKEGLTTETSTEERKLIQTSVAQAITDGFEVGTAECVVRPDALVMLGITGVPYPPRLEDVWSEFRAVGREHELVSIGVYRVWPVGGSSFRKKSRP